MKIDLFSSTGTKSGSLELPASIFGYPIRPGLIHQAVIMQQSNRRLAIAHVKSRGEVAGSTKKLYAQKHTGRARRGASRSPMLRGGGKAFGPRNKSNFVKDMPKSMRRAALLSCLSLKAKEGAIMGLESYGASLKTKEAFALLKKLPVQIGRRILVVAPSEQRSLMLSMRNVPNVKTIVAGYLNPEDIVVSRYIIFLKDAVTKAEEIWGEKKSRGSMKVVEPKKTRTQAEQTAAKKSSTKKSAAKKAAPKKSAKKSSSK